jgi:hypothetical protein
MSNAERATCAVLLCGCRCEIAPDLANRLLLTCPTHFVASTFVMDDVAAA